MVRLDVAELESKNGTQDPLKISMDANVHLCNQRDSITVTNQNYSPVNCPAPGNEIFQIAIRNGGEI